VISLSLYRFRDIIAQKRAKEILLRALSRDKLSHAYLFRGPQGVGKKTLAQSFAALINCKAPIDNDICGECESCRRFASGTQVDYLDLTPEGRLIKIDAVRELKKKLAFPPFVEKYRVVLIPDIHQTMAKREVANSLLKTLEEPPERTIMLLTADSSGVVLPTILSRCQVLLLNAVGPEELLPRLLEDGSLDEKAAWTLGALAGGSLGRAYELADGELLELRRDIVETICRGRLADPWVIEELISLAARGAEIKDGLYELFDLLRLWLRDLLLLSFGVGGEHLANRDLQEIYEDIEGRWPLTALYEKLDHINRAGRYLQFNCNRVSVCETLFWRLME